MNKLLFVIIVSFLNSNLWAISIGDKAPDFNLLGHDGKRHSLKQQRGKYVILEWFNHGCPFVRKHYDTKNMQGTQKPYIRDKRVVWYSIVSSAEGKQGHLATPMEASVKLAEEASHADALLLDHTGKVGRDYDAKTTPHMYIIDPSGKLVYQGAIDSIQSADQEDVFKAENYVKLAMAEVMAGKKVSRAKTSPYGCSVKY